MQNSKCVGKALYDMYLSRFGQPMNELKMHNLMYFAQKESLMETDDLLFDEAVYGWKFCPSLMSVRAEYKKETPYGDVTAKVDEQTKELLEKVIARYGERTCWSLSRLSRDEVSWSDARRGLDPGENGNVPLRKNMMRVDAIREKSLREYYERKKAH